MLDILKEDQDKDLLENFLKSPNREIVRLWFRKGDVDTELFQLREKEFAGIPIIGVVILDHFERNDTSIVSRGELDWGSVILPALELRFEDPENPDHYYIGTIDGKENVIKFLKGILKNRLGG